MERMHSINRALGLLGLAGHIGDALGSMRRRGEAHRAVGPATAGGDPHC